MGEVSTKPVQRAMAWCGVVFLALLFAGLLTAGFIPPIAPKDSAVQVANRYREHANAIRLGCVLMIFGAAFTIPFYGVVSAQLQRMEGHFTPLCFAQIAAGSAGVLIIIFPVIFFAVATFRPDRDPALTQLLNDLGWIPLLMVFPPAVAQVVVICVAVLNDPSPVPVFPRWTAYAMLWSGLLFTPAALLLFFKTGPFAWNGLLAFWVAVPAFGVFTVILIWATLRAIALAPDAEPASAAWKPPPELPVDSHVSSPVGVSE
jgi:hypothetical protein